MLPKEGKQRKLLLALQSCRILDLWSMTAFSEIEGSLVSALLVGKKQKLSVPLFCSDGVQEYMCTYQGLTLCCLA